MAELKVSIITVSYNSVNTIIDTLKSVSEQNYPNIEYIVVDGASTDGTIEVINAFNSSISKFVTEPDKGIYDAINKGIHLATGDIVGILNSDDFFYDNNVIEKVAMSFMKNKIDAVYGDVQFVDPVKISKKVRYYSSKRFNINKFRYGFMPAHPSFYVRRDLFQKHGDYKTDYKIAADFELLVRFMYLKNIRCKYMEMPFIYMRTGGISTRSFRSKITLNIEILRACNENGIESNYFYIYSKYLVKLFEYL